MKGKTIMPRLGTNRQYDEEKRYRNVREGLGVRKIKRKGQLDEYKYLAQVPVTCVKSRMAIALAQIVNPRTGFHTRLCG